MPSSLPEFDFAPYRLSGLVYGVLMNDPQSLAAIGDRVHQAPYKAPPKAPVLYLKPRNTLSHSGADLAVPPDFDAVRIGATVGMVIGRVACRVSEQDALAHVAGYVAINDVVLPHDSFYRPSLRFNARDGYCPIGPQVVPANQVASPDDLTIKVWIDGELVQQASTRNRVRSAARLIADVTDFMTLQPGDILTLGLCADAPLARPGQTLSIEIDSLGRIENTVIAAKGAQ